MAEFNLGTIDWLIQQIKDDRRAIEQLEKIKNDRIEQIKESYNDKVNKVESGINSKMESIRNYLLENDVKMVEAKTQTKFEGLSGEFVIKYPKSKIKRDDKQLLEYFKQNKKDEFIKSKIVEKPDWTAYKKQLEIRGDKVVDTTTGVVVNVLEVEVEPEKWEVK